MNKGIHDRIDLSYLCSCILYESIPIPQDEPESIKKADAIAYKVLEDLLKGKITYLKAEADLNRAFAMYQRIYLETGIKLGARLVTQLMNENITP